MSLKVVPISTGEANDFVANFHRHNKPVQGAKFAIGASDGERLVGVAIAGNPVSATLMDGFTLEVTRVCVLDDAPKNTCSFLYGRCWRIWQQMGGRRMITYTLESEGGASLRGAGWKLVGKVEPHNRWAEKSSRDHKSREWQPIYGQLKFRWEAAAESHG